MCRYTASSTGKMHPFSQDQPIDFSKKSEVKRDPLAIMRMPLPATKTEDDKDFVFPNLGVIANFYKPPPSFHQGAYPEFLSAELRQKIMPDLPQRPHANRYDPMRGAARNSRWTTSPPLSHSNAFSCILPPSLTNMYGNPPPPVHPSKSFNDQHLMQTMSSNFFPPDPVGKPTDFPLAAYSGKANLKSPKHRPFKSVSDEILKTDFSKQTSGHGGVAEEMRSLLFATSPCGSVTAPGGVSALASPPVGMTGQPKASTPVGDSSSPNSDNLSSDGGMKNGDSSGQNEGTSSDAAQASSESPRTDPTHSGSTQSDENPAKAENGVEVTPARRRGQPVDEDKKTETYRTKRNKNNMAAKKSRDARKKREDLMALKVQELFAANQALNHRIRENEAILVSVSQKYQDLMAETSMHRKNEEQWKSFCLDLKRVILNCGKCSNEYPDLFRKQTGS